MRGGKIMNILEEQTRVVSKWNVVEHTSFMHAASLCLLLTTRGKKLRCVYLSQLGWSEHRGERERRLPPAEMMQLGFRHEGGDADVKQ